MKKRIKKKAIRNLFSRFGKGSARRLAWKWRSFSHARRVSGYWPRKG